MPLLIVEIVERPGAELPRDLARRVADAAGVVFGSAPGTTWARIWPIPPERYAENGGGDPAEGSIPAPPPAPVFVGVIKRAVPGAEALEAEVERLTRAIAAACGRDPSEVHIVYETSAAGRVAFGGRLVG